VCVCVLFRCGSCTCSVHVLHASPFPRAPVFSQVWPKAKKKVTLIILMVELTAFMAEVVSDATSDGSDDNNKDPEDQD